MLELPEDERAKLKYFSALFRLKQLDAEFNDILAVFGHTLGLLHRENAHERNIIDLHQRQGALQLIETFFDHIKNARQMVEKLEGK